jgi:hypothetical protein
MGLIPAVIDGPVQVSHYTIMTTIRCVEPALEKPFTAPEAGVRVLYKPVRGDSVLGEPRVATSETRHERSSNLLDLGGAGRTRGANAKDPRRDRESGVVLEEPAPP